MLALLRRQLLISKVTCHHGLVSCWPYLGVDFWFPMSPQKTWSCTRCARIVACVPKSLAYTLLYLTHTNKALVSMVLCPASFNKNEDQKVLYSPEFLWAATWARARRNIYKDTRAGSQSVCWCTWTPFISLLVSQVWDRQNCWQHWFKELPALGEKMWE